MFKGLQLIFTKNKSILLYLTIINIYKNLPQSALDTKITHILLSLSIIFNWREISWNNMACRYCTLITGLNVQRVLIPALPSTGAPQYNQVHQGLIDYMGRFSSCNILCFLLTHRIKMALLHSAIYIPNTQLDAQMVVFLSIQIHSLSSRTNLSSHLAYYCSRRRIW